MTSTKRRIPWRQYRAEKRKRRPTRDPLILAQVRQVLRDQEERGIYDDILREQRRRRQQAGAIVLGMLVLAFLVVVALVLGSTARAAYGERLAEAMAKQGPERTLTTYED